MAEDVVTFLPLLIRFWWAPAIAVLAALLWIQTARLDHARRDINDARVEIAALSASKAESERLRDKEGQGATFSYEGLAAACAARLPIYIQAGRTLERIVNAQPNPDGSRGMCLDDCVRQLVGQAEPVGETRALPR
jgi:hypothetical protein